MWKYHAFVKMQSIHQNVFCPISLVSSCSIDLRLICLSRQKLDNESSSANFTPSKFEINQFTSIWLILRVNFANHA